MQRHEDGKLVLKQAIQKIKELKQHSSLSYVKSLLTQQIDTIRPQFNTYLESSLPSGKLLNQPDVQ